MSYQIQILSDKEFENLPYENVHNSLGLADTKTNKAYVRHVAHEDLQKYLVNHELEHLIGEDRDESHHDGNGVYYKAPAGGLAALGASTPSLQAPANYYLGASPGSSFFSNAAQAASFPQFRAPANYYQAPSFNIGAGVGQSLANNFTNPTAALTQASARLGTNIGQGLINSPQNLQGALSNFKLPNLSDKFGGYINQTKTGLSNLGASIGNKMGSGIQYLGQQAGKGFESGLSPNVQTALQTLPAMQQTMQGLAPGLQTTGQNLINQLQGAGQNMLNQLPGVAGNVGQNLSTGALGPVKQAIGQAGPMALLNQLFGGGGGGGGMLQTLGGLATSLIGNKMAPSVGQIPDISQLPSVQAPQNLDFRANMDKLDPALVDAINSDFDRIDAQEEHEFRNYWKNIRPNADLESDSVFARDYEEMKRKQAVRRADALAKYRFEFIAQNTQLSGMEMERLGQIAQLDIATIMAQLGLQSQEAQNFKQLFGSLGQAMISKGMGTSQGTASPVTINLGGGTP